MAKSFGDKLAHVTGGRRYCFFVMTFHGSYPFFERVRTIVSEATGVECIRADDIPAAGEDLRGKIHAAIDDAAFVIAEISEPRPNVYYEVGYAIARGKATLLLAREGTPIETDLLGMELIRYSETREGLAHLDRELKRHLALHTDSQISLLRAMVIPPDPAPSYILASPKPPSPSSAHRPRVERQTFGDHLGIVGILRAFGSVYGEHVVPNLVSARPAVNGAAALETGSSPDPQDDPRNWNGNFFLIGSTKSNPSTGTFLEEMQRGRPPGWRFTPAPGEDARGNYLVLMSGTIRGRHFEWQGRRIEPGETPPRTGMGLIVRGPHPRYPGRTVMILAGPHSAGTGAAALAATKSTLIRKIADFLGGTAVIADHSRMLWVLVRVDQPRGLYFGPEHVSVVDAAVDE